MKKLGMFLFLTLLSLSCTRNQSDDQYLSNIRTTAKNSLARSLGVISIKQTSNSTLDIITFEILSYNPIILNDYSVDLTMTQFKMIKYKGGIEFYIKKMGDKENSLNLHYKFGNDKSIVDLTNNKIVDDFYFNDTRLSTKLTLSIVLIDLLESNNFSEEMEDEFDNNYLYGRAEGCSRTITSIRYTRSSAEYHVNEATNTYLNENPGCERVYGVDSGCVWEDYGCVASQEIRCTGSGCDTVIGVL